MTTLITVFTGERRGDHAVVQCDERALNELVAFDWGGGKSSPGAVQLARAILRRVTTDEEALHYCFPYLWDVVAHLPQKWTITRGSVIVWLTQARKDNR